MKSGIFKIVDGKNKKIFISGSGSIDTTIRTVRMRLRKGLYAKSGEYGKVQESFLCLEKGMKVSVMEYCDVSEIERKKESHLLEYYRKGYEILNPGFNVVVCNEVEIMSYNKISEVGFPPPDTRVIVTFGDLTIYEIAEWYYDEDCQVKWQRSTMNRGLLPEHRVPTHWMELPVIKQQF